MEGNNSQKLSNKKRNKLIQKTHAKLLRKTKIYIERKNKSNDFNAELFGTIIRYGMELVERIPGITGIQKEEILLKVLVKLVNTFSDSGHISYEEVQQAVNLIQKYGPQIIQLIVMASKGIIKINQNVGEITTCSWC